MKIIISFFVILIGCFSSDCKIDEKSEINAVINQWHKAAAEANFDNYFGLMTADAVFIGTDASENWSRKEFEAYSKPHFDKGKAWTFHTLERNIYVDKNNKIAWFDELLDTSFKICRGSGVLEKVNGKWKIKHYVLSMTIPNETSKEVIAVKDSIESNYIQKLKSKK
ncbi:nuclear transport factor 2 family protein [Flavobacterium filum]|uniref:nuclear transport factor 2 family protein n=1 Tax=Flavobacterium TaxID=237 RepID=UPI0004085931|nr:nuclear transport factor 2 family protein [Flavobacterium filum]